MGQDSGDEAVEQHSQTSSTRTTRKTSISGRTMNPAREISSLESLEQEFDEVPLSPSMDDFHVDSVEAWNTLDNMPVLRFTFDGQDASSCNTTTERPSMEDSQTEALDFATTKTRTPFHKWVKSLRRKALQKHTMLADTGDMPIFFLNPRNSPVDWKERIHHRHSSSDSSFGFVRRVRSASMSVTTASIVPRSRRTTLLSSRGHERTDRSSRASASGVRLSEDSSTVEKTQIMDRDVLERSLQRRKILEELITTEEGYIGDIKFLMNVYVTILVSLPTLPPSLRSSINRNLAEIVELHEEILGDLHRVVPHSEYTQADIHSPGNKHPARDHHRWRSLDAVPEDKEGISWLQAVPGVVAEPQVAAEVAILFTKKMNRFFIYEEYGAKYEMMMKDIASAHRTMPHWDTYQKGLETLASSLGSAHNHGDLSKKSLTIGDLLVKPIQRVCKYPLLFAELLKYTPVCDCPQSHMEIENALVRLREATSEINRATDNSRVKVVLERTWLLQDRLVFPDQKLDPSSRSRIRSFGHIQLCGVLHVCWQTKDGVDGNYIVALLYRDWLCLASAGRADQTYTLQACIPLNNVKLDAADNGRGLQCHTAPFSWKLIFECDCQLYEVIMTACTPKESMEWRSGLSHALSRDSKDQTESDLFSCIYLDIKSLGTVFGKQGTIARRLSIHRATTVGPKSPLCQVIVKNTTVEKDQMGTPTNASINRSQSLLTTNGRIPVLTPSRRERARLEAMLSDVWTREVLPFPGMTTRARSEHLVRTSAHSMMRKLSVASIASTFTKRSASLASMNKVGEDANGAHGSEEPRAQPESQILEEVCSQQLSSVSKLSIIDDESVKHKSTPALTQGGRLPENNGLRHPVVTKTPATWHLEGFARGSPVLRTSSPNSLRLGRQGSAMSKSPCPSDKENARGVARESRKASSSSKLSSRWSKVDALRRGVVAQGFRSLFR